MIHRYLLVAALAVGCSGAVAPSTTPADAPAVDAIVADVSARCPGLEMRCGDACFDLSSNPVHCGACGSTCTASERCVEGACVPICAAPTVRCEGVEGDGCVDVMTDNAHCGACNRACDEGQACEEGRCVLQCPLGEAACGAECRDLTTDRAHCGACGNLCPLGQSCVEGVCAVVCSAGRTNCGGRCVDTQTTVEHCGACERRCDASSRCVAGVCRGSACGPQDSAAGRCDGIAIARCVDGFVSRVECPLGERCVAPPGASPACAMATGPQQVSGQVTHEVRPSGPGGVGSVRAEVTAGIVVSVIDESNRVLAQSLTDARGRYTLHYEAPPGSMVRVRLTAARTDTIYNFFVRDYAGATFAFTSAPFAVAPMVTRDIAVPIDGNSGALSIFSVVRRGFEFLRPYVGTRPAVLYLTWQRGRATGPSNASYFSGASSTVFLNGADTDPDEFDTAVIAHEFGHYVQRWYSRTNNPGGPHDGRPADPNLAFGEGGASFLGAMITGSRFYIDAGVTRLRLLIDLGAIPMTMTYSANASRPIEQPISEWLVAGAQFAMYRANNDLDLQARRAMNVLTGYLRRTPQPDRGEVGVDFVDYLDGYLCVNMGADRATIMSYVVTQRRFPYDFAFMEQCR